VADDDFLKSELLLSPLALHNLKIKNESYCEVSEFPLYLNCKKPEMKIFPTVDRIILQPVTPLPDCISNDVIDKAIKECLNSFKSPLKVNHQIVIVLKGEGDFQFSAVFSISKSEPQISGQFIVDENIEVFLKMKYITTESIPPSLQQSLSKSLILPRKFYFQSFPERSDDIIKFLSANGAGKFELSTALIYGPCGSGKRTLIRRLVDELGIPVYYLNLYKEAKEDVFEKTELFVELLIGAFKFSRTVIVEGFEMLDTALKIRSAWYQLSAKASKGSRLRLICCYNSMKVPNDYVLGSFECVQRVKKPGMAAIRSLAKELFELIPQASEHCKEEDFIGYSLYDFGELSERFFKGDSKFDEVFVGFKEELKLRRSMQLNTIEIPKVTWDQVAGMEDVKAILNGLIDRLQSEIRPTGVLLHGPPGTGKTLIAKALATQSRFSLLPVKGPELLSPYIGESESALREVFSEAALMSPCIIFFDELDALVPRRGEFGDSVGVTDRMVATFMTEMDQISQSFEDSCVFVIGATNRPDLIDPVLLRKGRFDTCVLLDGPKSVEERSAILAASCSGFKCSPDIDFCAPFKEGGVLIESLSPAQIASIASNASRLVFERKLKDFDDNDKDGFDDDFEIDPIRTEDLIESCDQLFKS
jgi:AAA+ superfamily predicted ATPase